MASGGIRHDFTIGDGITVGEDRVIRFLTRDQDGVLLTSFEGEATYGVRWLNALADADDWDDSALELFRKITGDGIPATASLTPPNIDVTLVPGDALAVGDLWYEAWRTDTGDRRRIAWGLFPVLN